MMTTVSSRVDTDEHLYRRSLVGDRDAFAQIVTRYQALICSLGYSASGDLSWSEDIAQETFLTAWQKLGELREPALLRSWLCGIARNLAAAGRRTERRRGTSEPLDSLAEQPTQEADPASHAVSQEEAAALWGALRALPDAYREPLILFYREQQSVREVALGLSLSEELVRQRLARGRALLREGMTERIEFTLRRTRPGAAFAVAVLAALPLATPPAAKAAVATATSALGVKGSSAAGKGVLSFTGAGMVFGPALGLLASWLGVRAVSFTAQSEKERIYVRRQAWRMVLVCFLFCGLLVLILSEAGKAYPVKGEWLMAGILAWVGILVWTLLALNAHLQRGVARLRGLEKPPGKNPARDA